MPESEAADYRSDNLDIVGSCGQLGQSVRERKVSVIQPPDTDRMAKLGRGLVRNALFSVRT